VEGATFAWPTTGIVFPIHDIVPQVTFAQFQDIDLEIREEQLHWVTATLEHLMQVPVLGLDELPEIVDMPKERGSRSPGSPRQGALHDSPWEQAQSPGGSCPTRIAKT